VRGKVEGQSRGGQHPVSPEEGHTGRVGDTWERDGEKLQRLRESKREQGGKEGSRKGGREGGGGERTV
jgi:hypothetical protein